MLKLADAPFHRVARLVPFRVVGMGVQTPALGWKDGLDAPLRQLGAKGTAVIGPVRDQAGQGRAGPGLGQGLSAVVALPVRRRHRGCPR